MATTDSKQPKLSGNNFLIVFVLITLLVLGITGLAAKALVTAVVRDSKVVKAKTTAVHQLQSDLTAAPQLVNAYSSLGSQATTLSDALPTTPDFPGLLVTLENMSSKAGVVLSDVTPTTTGATTTTGGGGTSTSATTGTSTPQTYEFSVSYNGSYPSLQTFLSEIENSARPMRVVGMQLSGSGSALTGDIDIDTFYQGGAQWPFSTETIK